MKKLVALFLCLSLLLSGCGKNDLSEEEGSTLPSQEEELTKEEGFEDQDPSESSAQQDSTFGLSYLPKYGLNPYTCNATVNRGLFSLMYESLFVVTQNFTASPVLCESFESTGGGTLYRFKLLPNACFHDGTPLSSEDVKASLRAARKSSLYAERLDHIAAIETPDSSTIELTLDTPYENFALMLDVPIVKASTVEGVRPVGTGAYYFKDQLLVRNPYWWKESHGVLSMDSIALSVADDSNDLRNQFEFGSTDLVYCDPNSTAAIGFRCDFEVWEAPTTIMHYLGFNLQRGWFMDEAFRSAVTYALDRDRYVNEAYGGFAVPTPLPCSPYSPFYDEQLAESHDYSPTKFQEALTNSGILTSSQYEGHSGTFLVCLDDPARVKMANLICDTLNEAGLRLTVNALERKQYEAALENHSYDVYLGEIRLTADFNLASFLKQGKSSQFSSSSTASLIALCTGALANSGTYSELYRKLLDAAPICPLVFKSHAVYVTRGKITNNTPGVDLIFHDRAQERSLADAYQTYREEEPAA